MWHYIRDGEKHGPVTKDNIQQLIDEGELTPNHFVWCSGMDDWKQISNVDDVHSIPPPLPEDKTVSSATESVRNTDAGTVQYAGFGSRLIAHCFDIAILVVVLLFVSGLLVIPDAFGWYSYDKFFNSSVTLVFHTTLITTGWMYYVLYETSMYQATPGKWIMNLKVTDINRDKIGFVKATGRHFGKILSGVILLVGFIMAAFTENGQALHDRLAGCLVVKK